MELLGNSIPVIVSIDGKDAYGYYYPVDESVHTIEALNGRSFYCESVSTHKRWWVTKISDLIISCHKFSIVKSGTAGSVSEPSPEYDRIKKDLSDSHTTREYEQKVKNQEVAHPGELLRDILILPSHQSVGEAAERMGVSRLTLSKILNGRGGVTPNIALRIAEAFPGSSADYWLTLQRNYDLSVARGE